MGKEQAAASASSPSGASAADPKSDPDYRACSDGAGPEAIPACDRAIASNKFPAKELASLYNDRGFFRLAAKDLDAALTDFSESIRVNPTASAFNNRGVAYRSKSENDLAIKAFDEAIRLDPKDATYFYHRGIVYKDKGDQDRAIEDFDEVIRLDPKNGEALTYRGHAYFTKGDYDHAIKDFDEAIQLDPKDITNYKFRGDAYAKKGARKQAHDDYAKAMSMHPDAEERKVIQDAMRALPPKHRVRRRTLRRMRRPIRRPTEISRFARRAAYLRLAPEPSTLESSAAASSRSSTMSAGHGRT